MPKSDELKVLGDATRYLLRSVLLVRNADLSARTPCPDWDLRGLLGHLRASLGDVTALITMHAVSTSETQENIDADQVNAIRARIVDFLAAWASAHTIDHCEVGGRTLPAETVAHVAAIEMVLHGWDISQACGDDRPIPTDLALALLEVSPRLARAGAAAQVFAEPLKVPTAATPAERLLAIFGRRSVVRERAMPSWRF